jgi:uncharacterized protein YuzE
MKLTYFRDTDTLYIALSDAPSVESEEIREGVVLDYGSQGSIVGIEIEAASRTVQLDRLEVSQLPQGVAASS